MQSLAGASGNDTLRICLVTEIFHPEDHGGQGQQAFEVARRVRHRGIGVKVLTRRNFAESAAHETLDGIDVERLPPTGLLKGKGWAAVLPTAWFTLGLLVRLLWEHRSYDLLLVQGVKAVLIPTLFVGWVLGKPCIVKIDALAELEQDLTPESLARMGLHQHSFVARTWARLRGKLLRRADALIAISAELADALSARGLPSARVMQIPNGIDLKRWTPSVHDKRELRSRLALPDRVLLTYAGRLSRAKGLIMLMGVWERLAFRHPQAHLVLIGSGNRSFDGCETQLRDLACQGRFEDRVTFTGQVDNLPDYLRASDLFVSCSESEGFGLSLVEAMAAGLPCVSTAVGAAPEIIRDRASGWLIPVNDAEALYAALEEALGNQARWVAMGAMAQQAVTRRFDLDVVAARYVELFASLLAQFSAGRASGPE